MLVLFSTATHLKFIIQKNFFGDIHYVWCSEEFDKRQAPRHTLASMVGSTSDPMTIYQDLRSGVESGDRHHSKINEQRASLVQLAAMKLGKGDISQDVHDDIVTLVNQAQVIEFRPIVYVIPAQTLGNRAVLVPAGKRAAVGSEYIIADLTPPEFRLIEGL